MNVCTKYERRWLMSNLSMDMTCACPPARKYNLRECVAVSIARCT